MGSGGRFGVGIVGSGIGGCGITGKGLLHVTPGRQGEWGMLSGGSGPVGSVGSVMHGRPGIGGQNVLVPPGVGSAIGKPLGSPHSRGTNPQGSAPATFWRSQKFPWWLPEPKVALASP